MIIRMTVTVHILTLLGFRFRKPSSRSLGFYNGV